MSKRGYTHIQVLLPEIRKMIEEGMTQREIAEHFGFKSKDVVKQLIHRERRKEREILSGKEPRPKGRPRRAEQPPHQKENAELERLRMENKLLRDFMWSAERK